MRSILIQALLITILLPCPSFSQLPEFVKDLNDLPVPILDKKFVEIVTFGFLGELAAFRGTDLEHGTELWRTDGTAAGTFMIADLVPGPESSNPRDITVSGLGTAVFFVATGPDGVRSIFSTTGSSITEVGSITSDPSLKGVTNILGVVNTTVYFGGEGDLGPSAAGKGIELWSTTGGVVTFIEDINPGEPDSNPTQLGTLGSKVIFQARTDLQGNEPWVTEGSAANTFLLANIQAGNGSSFPTYIGLQSNRLIFQAGSADGSEPWTTDGSVGNTDPLADINLGPDGSLPSLVADLPGVLLFSAERAAEGRELWKTTDGVSASLVEDIFPGTAGSSPARGAAIGNSGLFFAETPNEGRELWKSDGTSGGTVPLKDIVPGAGSPIVTTQLVSDFSNRIFFGANDGISGNEPWVSDGTGANTQILKDLNPGAKSSNPSRVFTIFTAAHFFALDGIAGPALLASDGTGAGTSVVTTLIDPAHNESGSPDGFFEASGKGCFNSRRADTGFELVCSDGTNAGTALVKAFFDLTSDAVLSPIAGDSRAFFGATDLSGGLGAELWVTDATLLGTTLVKDIFPGSSGSDPSSLTKVGNKLFFSAEDQPDNRELWITDGTSGGTLKIIELGGTTVSGVASNLGSAAFNGKFVFAGRNAAGNEEPWISDGTEIGTSQIAEINNSGRSNPTGFIEVNGALFFAADNGSDGVELYRSDGTAPGTEMVVDLDPGSNSGVGGFRELLELNGTLFFVGSTSETGAELFRSDGTAGGTTLVKDIFPGMGGSNVFLLKVLNNLIYFHANDGVSGREPWRSDGTEAGTFILKDVNPLNISGPSFPFVALGGLVYFRGFDEVTVQLWRTDGSVEGTVKISNFPGNIEAPTVGVGSIGAGPGNLLMSGNDATLGFELFTVRDSCPNPEKFSPGVCGCGVADLDFNANGILDCVAGPTLRQKLELLISILKQIKGSNSKKNRKKVKELKTLASPLASEIVALASAEVGNLGISSANQTSLLGITGKLAKFVKAAFKISASDFKKKKKTAIKNVNKALGLF